MGAGREMNSTVTSSSLIPVGSLAVLDIPVEKIEDPKLYMSCIAPSRDKQPVYAKSSGKEICSLSLGCLPLPHPQQRVGKMRAKSQILSWSLGLLGVEMLLARDMDEETQQNGMP